MSAAGRRLWSWLLKGLQFVLLVPIWGYRRFITPMLPASCRFYPSCATYAEEALRLHGPLRGSWLAVRRLGRCHPWTPGGVDHVPGSPKAEAGSARVQPSTLTYPSTLTGA